MGFNAVNYGKVPGMLLPGGLTVTVKSGTDLSLKQENRPINVSGYFLFNTSIDCHVINGDS